MCGLVTGNYEFVAYIESHPRGIFGPEGRAISAFQSQIPYVRFTIIDADTGVVPNSTISESTTYIGEHDLSTGSSFIVTSNSNVDFIVGGSASIVLNGGFKITAGSSFKAVVGGGTPLSKTQVIDNRYSYSTSAPELLNEVSSVAAEGRIAVFPNPVNSSMYVVVKVDLDDRLAFSVYDMQGRRIGQPVQIEVKSGRSQINLSSLVNVGQLANGAYILRVSGGSFSQAVSFLVSP